MTRLLIATAIVLCLSPNLIADDPVFSGPQVGERLVPFEATGVLGKMAGKKVEVVSRAKGRPQMIIFVHQITRPSIGVLRTITNFASAKERKELKTELVFLAEDRTEMEARIRRMQHALPKGMEPLIAVGGAEGPGAYGLNRKMTLTVIVGEKDKVTANFPLIQPSIQVDAPNIGHAMVKATGGSKKPTLKDMGYDPQKMMARKPRTTRQAAIEEVYRPMMGRLIARKATKEQVDEAAKAIEELAEKNEAFRDKVGTATRLITSSQKLTSYGTKHAQAYLKKWAKEFAPQRKGKTDDTKKDATKAVNKNTEKPDKDEDTSSRESS